MKRADISAIFPDATKEQIDQLLDLNGADVSKAKGDLEGVQGQLAAAQTQIAELQAGASAAEQAQQQITQLQTELEGMKTAEARRLMREKVSGEKKVPVHLLTGETEEDCAAQADAILAFAQPAGYPVIRDGGDPGNRPSPTPKDSFVNWAKEFL